MRCIGCGNEIAAGMRYCKYCGMPVKSAGEHPRQPEKTQNSFDQTGRVRCPVCGELVKEGNIFCTTCGASISKIPKENNIDATHERVAKKKRKNVVPIILVLSLLSAVCVIAVVVFDMLKDKEDDEVTLPAIETITDENTTLSKDDDKEDSVNTEINNAAQNVKESDNQEDLPNTSDIQNQAVPSVSNTSDEDFTSNNQVDQLDHAQDEDDAEAIVSTYLYAFIDDVNNGTYRELYSAIASGSNMEELQQKFIDNADLHEELLDYDIINTKREDNDTYHITVVEKYDVTNYKDGSEYNLEQKCTYQVCRQRDGSWKIADFVGNIEVVNKSLIRKLRSSYN